LIIFVAENIKTMKNLIITALLTVFVASAYAQESYFGEKITDKGAVAAAELPKKIGNKEKMTAKVTGTVESVCQAKGCWMKVKTADGQTMRVSFKDYGFFVPKDIAGRTVVIEGEAKMKTTPVVELQHYAEDAGKSKAEIAKITEPKRELTFVAEGVIVKK
jgi:hypothetical protein